MPSVTACHLLFNSHTSSMDELGRWTFNIMYRVTTDGVMGHQLLADEAQLASPHPLPARGATYSFQGDANNSSYLTSYQVSPQSEEGSQKLYHVTCAYTPPPDGDISFFEPNPFLRDPVIWFDREAYTRIVERNVFGQQIVNKCGRLYDTPHEEEDVRTVIVVEFNVATLSEVAGYARYLRNAVNSTTWFFRGLQFPPRTVLAREVASTPPIVQGAYTYFHLAFRFVLANGSGALNPNDPSTWDVPILERGYQAYRVANQPGSLTDAEAEPFLLAENGTKLPDGQPGVYTFWRVKREVDFNILPFSG